MTTRTQRAAERAAEREQAARLAAIRERFTFAGGAWYCRTHDVQADWHTAQPTCWRCEREPQGGVVKG